MDLKIKLLSAPIFNTLLDVRIYDINYGNHLGHDSLISLLHESRFRFLKKLGYTEFDINGVGILVTNLVVNYLNESFYSDKLSINIEIGEASKATLEMIYQVLNQNTNKEVARALTTLTFYDYKKNKVARVPQEFLKAIELIDKASL